jgi:sugar lactone lactonase YvrE
MNCIQTIIFRATLILIVAMLSACGGGSGGGGSTPPSSSGTTSYTIGGSITGLNGTLVLQDNGGDNLTVSANGPFTFANKIASGSAYSVTILTQPAHQKCTVASGSGSTAANVSNVAVSCLSQMGGAMQGRALTLTPEVSTMVDVTVAADGAGTAARFNNPTAVVSDGTNLYVADTNNNKIRQIVIATGVVTTLAGSPTNAAGAADGTGTAATFNGLRGITFTGGNLYVTDGGNNKIRKIVIATGEVSSFTGPANVAVTPGASDRDFSAQPSAARFNLPSGITTDGTNLYVVDTLNQKIRQIAIATGYVSSLTGVMDSPSVSSTTPADGAGATSTFYNPFGIAIVGANLYVTDQGNNKIRQIVIATGVVSSFTGASGTSGAPTAVDGARSAATFNFPLGITTDGNNLYVSDALNQKIRVIGIASGVVSSLTGTADTQGTAGAVDGPGATASFNSPYGITIAGGNLYVADAGNNTIRTIALTTAAVTTLAGNAQLEVVTFSWPFSVATDGINLYVADTQNPKIRKIVIATGEASTLAGTGTPGANDGAGATASFNNPSGITTDGTNLYVADVGNHKIRKIVIASGDVSSVTGVANTPGTPNANDGAGATATFDSPYGITTDGSNLYVADMNNHKIRKIVIATGEVSSVTGVANTPATQNANDGAGAIASFNSPRGITTDGTNLYVADMVNHKIRKIVIATGAVSSLTGVANTPGTPNANDGAGATASFNYPSAITTDGTNLYVADMQNHKIRKIVIASGDVSSVTGGVNTPGTPAANDGAGATASFDTPIGITTDGTNLYVADPYNNKIRKIQ